MSTNPSTNPQFQEQDELFHEVLRGTQSAVVVLDDAQKIVWFSSTLITLFPGVRPRDIRTGMSVERLSEVLRDDGLTTEVSQVSFSQQPAVAEIQSERMVGYIRRLIPRPNGGLMLVYTQAGATANVSLLDGHMMVLDMVGKGHALQEVLDYLACFCEAHARHDVHASIVLLDQDALRLCHGASPSLPESYARAINGDSSDFELNLLDGAALPSLKLIEDMAAQTGLGKLRDISLAHQLNSGWMMAIRSSDGQALGLLMLYLKAYRPPGPAETLLLEFACRAAAIAIEYAQQEARARLRAQQQEAVAELGWQALVNIDITQLMHQVVESVARVLKTPLSQILQVGPDKKALSLQAGIGWQADFTSATAIGTGTESQAGYTLQQRSPIVVADLRLETRFIDNVLLQHEVVSGASVIIAGEQGEAYGVLSAHTAWRRGFTANDIMFLQSVANVLAAAIGRHRMEETLRRNRKQITDQYAHLNAIYDTAPVGLCFIDADLRFQWINRHFASLVGMPIVDMKGATFKEALPFASDQIERCCQQALSAGQPVLDREITWSVPGDVGKSAVLLCSFYPIVTKAEGLLGINMMFQDLTERKQADEERAQLAEIVASSYDAIIGISLDGKITSWNAGAEKLYEYTAEEAIGAPIEAIIPPDRMREFQGAREVLDQGGRISLVETERVSKSGRRIYVSFTLSPIRDRNGRIVAASTIERDVSKRKRIEDEAHQREQEMRFILKSAKVGTWDWDMISNRVKWSDNLEALHGQPAGSFKGTFQGLLEDVHHDDVPVILNAIRDSTAAGREYHVEYRVLTADGALRWVEGKGQVFRDAGGKPYRMAGICTDITERKQAEQALRISEERMRRQAVKLAAADKQKDNFIAMLSHELRNPLAPISNVVEVLQLKKDPVDPQLITWGMNIIDRQVTQLARLVDDLLDVARITQGIIQLQKKPVDVRNVINQAVETAEPLIKAREHNLVVDMPEQSLELNIDAARITQVIANLLNNAAKYSGEKKNIWLTLSQNDEVATVTVRDDGAGIAEDMLPHIFDLFTQADHSLDRTQGGLGLGLTLVKRLVEMHSGSVTAHSAGLGKGAEFSINLPMHMHFDGERAQPEHALVRKLKRPTQRILVVDDNADSADAFAALLRMRNCDVKVVYDGRAAINVAASYRPHVVFLDIGLPGMNGYEVAEVLRKKYQGSIVLVALTGYGQNTEQPRNQQFDHYILKPIDIGFLDSLNIDGRQ